MPIHALVFVYGTLRQGGSNHALMADSRLLGRYTTAAVYTMLDVGAYPGVVDEGRDTITGEVYAVSPVVLERLDRLEDVPRTYRRARLDTPWGEAWMYLYRPGASRLASISGGDWMRRR